MKIKLDHQGRIILPNEIKRYLGIDENTQLLIKVAPNTLTICKDIKECIFFHQGFNLIHMGEHSVCTNCIELLVKANIGDYLYPTIIE